MTTKAQERKALEQIRKIVEGLGEDSYIGHAFEGCFEMAEENIDNDWWGSMKDLAAVERSNKEATEKKLEEATNHMADQAIELAKRREEIEDWKKMYQSKVEHEEWLANESTKHWNNFREQEDRANALEEEIIRLKAKLYDMMTA